jgi:hypothetical protein
MSAPRAILAALAALSFLSPFARAETLTCTDLTALPATISAPGHYCLNADFSQVFTTAAINIAASNVELDCNGHAVTQAGTSGVAGVYASNRSQVTVRGCTLNNFGRGIAFFESGTHLSLDNRIVDNVLRGSQITAIQAAGSGNVVAGNHIAGNVGSPSGPTSYGILVTAYNSDGIGNVVRNNEITRFVPNASVNPIGIYLLGVDGSTVADNHIDSLWPPTSRASFGIYFGGVSVNGVAVRNHVFSASGAPSGSPLTFPGAQSRGIYFEAIAGIDSNNVCRDNVVGHWLTDIEPVGSSGGCLKLDNVEF